MPCSGDLVFGRTTPAPSGRWRVDHQAWWLVVAGAGVERDRSLACGCLAAPLQVQQQPLPLADGRLHVAEAGVRRAAEQLAGPRLLRQLRHRNVPVGRRSHAAGSWAVGFRSALASVLAHSSTLSMTMLHCSAGASGVSGAAQAKAGHPRAHRRFARRHSMHTV